MQLQGFTKRRYHANAKIKQKLDRMKKPREGVMVDGIAARVLEWQGFIIEDDSSSFYQPQALYERLERYSPEQSFELDLATPEWNRAMKATFKMFAKRKGGEYLQAITDYIKLYNNLDLDKSSGATAGNGKRDDFWYALDRDAQVRKGIKRPNPCLSGARTQLGSKIRLVWEYPYEMTIMEERFAVPLIKKYLKMNTSMAFGKSKFELGGMITGIESSYGTIRGLDFSKFDSTIPASLIRFAFDVLATWFPTEVREEYGWKHIVNFFINTPIVMPDGIMYSGKKHGVPSGSFFTQMIDSIVNVTIQYYLSFKLGYSIDVYKFKVLGDDVIISIPKEIPTTRISEEIATFGMIINAEKTKEYAHFLGATWIHGIPYRSKMEIAKKIKFPESYRKYSSKEKYDRWALGVQLIMQFSYAYANAWELLPQSRVSNNMSRLDYMPMYFAESYQVPEWNRLLSNVGWLVSSSGASVEDMKTKTMTELILA